MSLGGRKQRSVLAVLALHVNRVVPTSRLMDAVWGEESFDRLPNTLQVYVYNIRRILEPTKAKQDPYRVIVSQEPGYVLRLDPQQVDSARFEAMVASARRLSRAGSVAEALTEYAEAQGCWRGSRSPTSWTSHLPARRPADLRLCGWMRWKNAFSCRWHLGFTQNWLVN